MMLHLFCLFESDYSILQFWCTLVLCLIQYFTACFICQCLFYIVCGFSVSVTMVHRLIVKMPFVYTLSLLLVLNLSFIWVRGSLTSYCLQHAWPIFLIEYIIYPLFILVHVKFIITVFLKHVDFFFLMICEMY